MKNMPNVFTPPCPKCPYKQGMIQTVVNPCPQCKLNNYSSYKQFIEQTKRKTREE